MYLNMLKYRLTHLSGHGGHGDELFVSGLDSSTRQALETFPSLFMIGKNYGQPTLSCVFTGPKPSLEDLAVELHLDAVAEGSQRPCSDMELLAAVISRGDVHGSYGNTYWGRESETLHLLTCGIDWSRFRGVRDTSWSTFTGTFDDDRRTKVLSAEVICRCEDEEEVRFGLEPPSIATLLAALSSNTLEKIFDV
jgi:hypothetical protein